MAARAVACARRLLAVAAPRFQAPARASSYRTSQMSESVTERPRFEAFANPPEWIHVENLLHPKTVPEPKPKNEYPSGWRPQSPEATQLPYFVARNKNHQVPVYLKKTHFNNRVHTLLKRVKGDVRQLRDEVQAHLRKKHQRVIPVMAHEMCGQVHIRGDYYYDVVDFLYSKGL